MHLSVPIIAASSPGSTADPVLSAAIVGQLLGLRPLLLAIKRLRETFVSAVEARPGRAQHSLQALSTSVSLT
jgi:hypothetical protein